MPADNLERTLDDVVASLRDAPCSVLIGAGCSVSSGIPLAAEFVREIEMQFAPSYKRAAEKTYPHCMAELAPGQRDKLIGRFIDDAKINWAHMALAQLMRSKYVTRVLTTNFDPLVTRACATVGIFPNIYDLAISSKFTANRVRDPAVFYLHGQRGGFVNLHTKPEVDAHHEAVAPVFADATKGRVWIVCGYSGDNDPVFDHLANVDQFDQNLYWIGYKDADPPRHVREYLLQPNKYAFYVRGFDADKFFVELARRLECFPPQVVGMPFTHLKEVTERLTAFRLLPGSADLKEAVQKRIQAAIDEFESKDAVEGAALEANKRLFSGDNNGVIQLFSEIAVPSEDLCRAAAWAFIGLGNQAADRAIEATGNVADALFAHGYEKYAAAFQIKPDMHEALYNWGIALASEAKTKSGDEADALWRAACEKYAAALQIKPNMHEAPYNWGNALAAQAKTKSGDEADALRTTAGEKYAAALQIKPDKHEALGNWGNALAAQAKTKSGDEADALLRAAGEKFAAALQIKPGDEGALNNWSNAFLIQAALTSGDARDEFLAAAAEKAVLANATVPGKGSYNLACISALRGDAENCRKWLLDAKEHGKLPKLEHLLRDTDLASVRDLPWFTELLADVQ